MVETTVEIPIKSVSEVDDSEVLYYGEYRECIDSDVFVMAADAKIEISAAPALKQIIYANPPYEFIGLRRGPNLVQLAAVITSPTK